MKDDIRLSNSINEQPESDKRWHWNARHGRLSNEHYWAIGIISLFLVAAFSLTCMHREPGASAVILPTVEDFNRGIVVYDNKDRYICTLRSNADRRAIPFSKVSLHAINAVIAAEDRRFHDHNGVDFFGIVRAFYRNQQAGEIVEGGSTITQQVVKNLYLDRTKKTYSRKIKEALMALEVDSHYPKERILETYLNLCYFGGGVCGIERAAQHYFSKHANQLTAAESAYLAGLINSPSILADPDNRAMAIARQREVLHDMQECGFLKPEEALKAQNEKLAFKPGPTARPWPHYVGYVEQVLKRELGDDIWKNGWKVYTNLDVKAQTLAEKHINKAIKSAPKGINQGALVTMSLKDGALLAIVGGAGKYQDVQWNRALFPHTAGSSFKPFVYLAGLMNGTIQPDTMINDSPLVIESRGSEPYKPKNYDNSFKGWMTARDALVYSRNVCAVRVGQAVGISNVISVAQACGIKSQLEPYPSLALGACALTPLEMTAAYATIARNGSYITPLAIRRIETEQGKVYREYHPTTSTNLPEQSVAQLVDVLQDVVRRGTGTRARLPQVAVAGKTGTANDCKDLWFIGFTPEVITTVWAGNDLNKKVRGSHISGGTVMAKVWHDYMAGFNRFNKPVQLVFAEPREKLASNVPRYDERSLLAYGMSATNYDAALYAAQITNTDDLEKMEKSGIARNIDLQRARAIRKYRDSATIARMQEQTNNELVAVDRLGDKRIAGAEDLTRTSVSHNNTEKQDQEYGAVMHLDDSSEQISNRPVPDAQARPPLTAPPVVKNVRSAVTVAPPPKNGNGAAFNESASHATMENSAPATTRGANYFFNIGSPPKKRVIAPAQPRSVRPPIYQEESDNHETENHNEDD